MKNGNSVAREIAALKVTFRDRNLTFRYFPHPKCNELKWQALREVVEPVTMQDGSVQLLERLELVGWASTRDALINQLA